MFSKLQVGLICITLAIAAYFAYQMTHLTFWGYKPIFFFISTWAAFILIAKKWFWPDSRKLRWLSLSTFSAVLLALGFPPLLLTPILFIAFIPLLIVQYEIGKSNVKNRDLTQWKYAFHAFMVWNLLTTFWVANSAFIPSLAAFILNSLFMSIPWLGMIRVGRLFPKLKGVAFIAFWFTWEAIHLSWEISWPWLTLGNAWAGLPMFVQWYEYTGVFGGGLWILAVNYLLFSCIDLQGNDTIAWEHFKSGGKKYSKKIFAILGLIAIPILISLIMYFSYVEKGIPVNVAIVQANFEPHYQKFTIPENEQFNQFKKLSRQAITDSTDYLLWPESSVGNDVPFRSNELNVDPRIQLYRDSIIGSHHLSFVPGITSMKIYKSDEIPGPAARYSNRQNVFYEINNAVIQIQKEDVPVQQYVKSRLVPGAEIFPYKDFLPFLKPLVDILGGSTGLATQADRTPLDNGKHKVAAIICYESIYGNYLRDFFKHGAEAIFIVTNDGWWDNTPGYVQHAMFGALRAIEFRKSIARAANTGISCSIDQRGNFHHVTAYGVEAGFETKILFNSQQTFYLKYGDYLAEFGIAASIVLILLNILSRLGVKGLRRN